MFRRREDGTEELITNGNESAGAAPTAAATPVMPQAPAAPMAAAPQAPTPAAPMPQAPAQAFRPTPPQAAMAASRPAPTMPSAPSMPSTPIAANQSEARTPSTPVNRPNAKRVLTVGPDIQMKGEIMSCDRVVIEGTVDATMRDVHTIELTETGALKGTAEVEDAEISGAFEGDLVVRGKLTIHATGRVRGNVTYGEIEIQRGGQVSGNIRNVADTKGQANGNPANKARAA